MANSMMEIYLEDSIFKYPTGSAFLLRTSHGHIETSKLDVVSDGKALNSSAEVQDAISKLGLDK